MCLAGNKYNLSTWRPIAMPMVNAWQRLRSDSLRGGLLSYVRWIKDICRIFLSLVGWVALRSRGFGPAFCCDGHCDRRLVSRCYRVLYQCALVFAYFCRFATHLRTNFCIKLSVYGLDSALRFRFQDISPQVNRTHHDELLQRWSVYWVSLRRAFNGRTERRCDE